MNNLSTLLLFKIEDKYCLIDYLSIKFSSTNNVDLCKGEKKLVDIIMLETFN